MVFKNLEKESMNKPLDNITHETFLKLIEHLKNLQEFTFLEYIMAPEADIFYFNFMEKTVKIKWDLDYGLFLETEALSTADRDLFLNILDKEILSLENQ
jgi:hypothetical protein